MNNVIVEYDNFSKDNSNVQKITFDLLPDIFLSLSQETVNDNENSDVDSSEFALLISMTYKHTDEIEITGTIDKETLNALIRSLIIFKGQL